MTGDRGAATARYVDAGNDTWVALHGTATLTADFGTGATDGRKAIAGGYAAPR